MSKQGYINGSYRSASFAPLGVSAALLFLSQICCAQVVAPVPALDPAPELRRQQERQQSEQLRRQTTPDVLSAPSDQKVTSTLIPAGETPCFAIDQIQLVGADADKFSWVLDAISGEDKTDSPIRQCLGAEGINVVLNRAQEALIKRGFVTSRVLAQPQDISEGKLTLSVIAGRLAAIRYAGGTTASTNNREPARALLPITVGEILNLRDIEQSLEMLKRAPSAQADIKIEPGSQPGQSELVITYEQKMPLRGNISIDDSGSKSSGKNQGAITLAYDNPFLLNDLFYVTFNHKVGSGTTHSTNGKSFHYSVPVGYWTLAFNHSESSYYQTVIGAAQNYIYSGTSANADVKVSRLMYRDASKKSTVSLRGFRRQSNNFIDDTEVQVQRRKIGGWELGFNHRQYIGQSTIEGNINYKRGTGAFNSLPSPEDLFGEGTSRFALLAADLNYTQQFKVGQQPVRYSGNFRGQWNRTPLTPQDRFAIGSRYSVRGFDGESSLSAERGWTWRNDWSFALGDSGQELYTALDFGHVSGPSSKNLAGKSLAGMALGLRGGGSGIAKSFQYDFFIGRAVYKPAQFRNAPYSLGMNLNFSF